MDYSETGITGDVKDITRTFDTSGTVLDLPDTATKAFIDIGLTNGVLPDSDSISSDGSISAVRTFLLSSNYEELITLTNDVTVTIHVNIN
jgi:hypothetical protein